MALLNKVQLITYPDSLGGDLARLDQALDQYFPSLFPGGIHILPPYPSSGDRGFAPLTYLEIDPRWGSWADIHRIGAKRPVLLDLIVNHISSSSPLFQDFLRRGEQSPYADLFLPLEMFWPGGTPSQADIDKIFLRRRKPYSEYGSADTGARRLWTTFGPADPSAQVDINVFSETARHLFRECFATFSQSNVKIVRLDAVGYVIKKLGTSCFFVEPEIFEFLDWLRSLAGAFDIELLPEVHAEFAVQARLAERGYWIYDFVLPYLVLEALINKNSRALKAYLANRPARQFTMLDCHDGIPVKPDLDGLLDVARARQIAEVCLARGGNFSRIFSAGFRDPDGFDVHQIRGTYYSLLNRDDQAYLIARAIQLFVPGIPQVYYVGLLAGENDEAGYLATGDGREINRRNYSLAEIAQEIQRPVVQQLIQLIQLRNAHPAFAGQFSIRACSDHELSLSWEAQDATARLDVDLLANTGGVSYSSRSSGTGTITW